MNVLAGLMVLAQAAHGEPDWEALKAQQDHQRRIERRVEELEARQEKAGAAGHRAEAAAAGSPRRAAPVTAADGPCPQQLEASLRAARRGGRKDDAAVLRDEARRRYKGLLGLPPWLMTPGVEDFR